MTISDPGKMQFAPAPFAEYELTEIEPWMECSLQTGERYVLDPISRMNVGREADISVNGDNRLYDSGWGGRRNHLLSFQDGAWTAHHMGHSRPVLINDEPLQEHQLVDGDRISPARGLVFTFRLRPDLEALSERLGCNDWHFGINPDYLDQILRQEEMGSEEERHKAYLHLLYRRFHMSVVWVAQGLKWK